MKPGFDEESPENFNEVQRWRIYTFPVPEIWNIRSLKGGVVG